MIFIDVCGLAVNVIGLIPAGGKFPKAAVRQIIHFFSYLHRTLTPLPYVTGVLPFESRSKRLHSIREEEYIGTKTAVGVSRPSYVNVRMRNCLALN